jgi:hypothetical protein
MKKFLSPSFLPFVIACLLLSCKKENTQLTITISPDHPTVQSAVTFTSSQTGSGWQYSWDFGDGNTNSTNTPSTTHSYLQQGTYNVTLNVYHNGSPMGFCSASVTVQ